jgi:hypothetical protein
MGTEGSLQLVWLNKGEAREPEFSVSFVRYGADGCVTDSLKFLGEESLWAFLALSILIGSHQVQDALSDLHSKGSAEIDSLNISDEELRRFKLVG